MIKGSEDYDFWLALIEQGAKAHILNKTLIHCRKSDSYKSRGDFDKITGKKLELQIIKNNPKIYYWFIHEAAKRLKKSNSYKRKYRRAFFILLVYIISISLYISF